MNNQDLYINQLQAQYEKSFTAIGSSLNIQSNYLQSKTIPKEQPMDQSNNLLLLLEENDL